MRGMMAWLQRGVFALFLLIFGLALIGIAVYKQHPPLVFWPTLLLALAGMFFAHRFFERHARALKRWYPALLVALLVLFPLAQIPLGMTLEIDPYADFGSVFYGAQAWHEEYTFSLNEDFEQYFASFPNNIPLMGALALIFRGAAALGCDEYYLAAVVVNCVLATLSTLLAVDVLRRVAGIAAAWLGALVFVALPSYYVLGAIFYSDTMTFIFPVLTLWLYLLAADKPWWLRLPLLALMAAVAFVGFQIKATAGIMLVAVLAAEALRWRWKNLLWLVPVVTVMFVTGIGQWNQYVYDNHLDPDRIEEEAAPLSAWLLKGLEAGDHADVFRMGESKTERGERAWQELQAQFAHKLRDGSLLPLCARKLATALDSGTLGLADFLDDRPWNDTPLHAYLLYGGERYPQYDAYCGGIAVALLLLAFYGAFRGLRQPSSASAQAAAVWIALLGIALFLMVWEVRDRYFSNYFAVLIIAGVTGMGELSGSVRWPEALRRDEHGRGASAD